MSADQPRPPLIVPSGRWYGKLLALPLLAIGGLQLFVALFLGKEGTDPPLALLVLGGFFVVGGLAALLRGGIIVDPRFRTVTRYIGLGFKISRETLSFDDIDAVWLSPKATKDRVAGLHYKVVMECAGREIVLRKLGRYDTAKSMAGRVASTLGFPHPAEDPPDDQPWQAWNPSSRGISASSQEPPREEPETETVAGPAAPAPSPTAQTRAAVERRLDSESRFRRGTGWFFWIGGLSFINSVLMFHEVGITFVVGLGITQFVAGLGVAAAEQAGNAARHVALVFEVLIALAFVGIGALARKRHGWAIIAGMVLYALDAVLLAVCKQFFAFGFHILALFGLYGGLKALAQLRRGAPVPAAMTSNAVAEPPAAPQDSDTTDESDTR